MVFDQYNSVGTIQRLQARALEIALDRRPNIYERTSTAGLQLEVSKKTLHLGLSRAPPHELAKTELEHLVVVGEKVSASSSGDVQTDDVAGCLIGMTYTLLQDYLDVFQRPQQFATKCNATRRPSGPRRSCGAPVDCGASLEHLT